jgi:hypothetical protein
MLDLDTGYRQTFERRAGTLVIEVVGTEEVAGRSCFVTRLYVEGHEDKGKTYWVDQGLRVAVKASMDGRTEVLAD